MEALSATRIIIAHKQEASAYGIRINNGSSQEKHKRKVFRALG